MRRGLILFFAISAVFISHRARADDGYRLWLRYDRLSDNTVREAWSGLLNENGVTLRLPSVAASATLAAASDELRNGLTTLTGSSFPIHLATGTADPALGEEGYRLLLSNGRIEIVANRDVGALYGAFALLREVQLLRLPTTLAVISVPRVQRRMLDHWDGLNRFVERGYAGASLWDWFTLPDYRNPRYRDYARACASVGLNGTVLNNVNAEALILTPRYLEKVAALADEFRPYGIRVYLSSRFSAPMELGGLKTADPLAPEVAAWWRAKADDIYHIIPDFGGFLVKANSEGQPGPQDYHRTHADGANVIADALAPHGGVVLWRAFVYAANAAEDRVKQAYNEFKPLDGQFHANVVVQIKNGPLDFMPREPFHPLFGAMPRTSLALELQITQEYLGGSTQVAFLAPMWREVLDADTFASGSGSTVARVVDGSLGNHSLSAIAGVANTGSDRNWTGHPLAQANWYAFGRLAWDPSLPSETIADEWTHLTFGHNPKVVETITRLLLHSREAVVDYSMPLGLHHIMAEGHHYGPGPWVDLKKGGRADWTAVYYHRADERGLGFDRTANGSDALSQYAPQVARIWSDPATCPENLLLWFHHVSWDARLKSGRTLWEELGLHYQRGVDEVRAWRKDWAALSGEIDATQHAHVAALLRRQELDACDWRDACLLYFAQFSKRPLPAGVDAPAHDLAYYKSVQLHYVPGNPGER